ncbi:nucleoside hydrolase [Komagataeibacter rhaeticus]|nr:nucleoside hydrolase [Komagataeibacter rhaeticus]
MAHDLPPGNDGLGAAHLVQAIRACPQHGATVCCSGPLTTLALALVQAPDVGAHLHGVIFSGGAFHTRGNATTVAERNVAADPEAAATVLAAGVPVTIVPLGCTDRLKADAVWMEQIAPWVPIPPPWRRGCMRNWRRRATAARVAAGLISALPRSPRCWRCLAPVFSRGIWHMWMSSAWVTIRAA